MSMLMDIEPAKLVLHVVIVSLSTLGIVEWLKNFVHYKNKRYYAILGLIVLVCCVSAQFLLTPIQVVWFNMFTLALATMQFGHTALIKIPEKLIGKLLDKGV